MAQYLLADICMIMLSIAMRAGMNIVYGGLEYLRRSYNLAFPPVEMSVYADDDFELVRKSLIWGARGVSRIDSLKYLTLVEQQSDDIKNILSADYKIRNYVRELLEKELLY